MIVTIDGPAGSGKSTLAKSVAKKMGWMFLDTGAMYRAVTLRAVREEVGIDQPEALARLAKSARVEFEQTEHMLRVFLDGEDVTDAVRTEAVSQLASQVSAIAPVREALVEKQRQLGELYINVVSEGRDQGSVVFPGAEVKVFLDADPGERARRRYKQLIEQGQAADYDKILAAIKERDLRDTTRSASPLVVPAGATVIDTTGLAIEQVLDKILKLIEQAKKGEKGKF